MRRLLVAACLLAPAAGLLQAEGEGAAGARLTAEGAGAGDGHFDWQQSKDARRGSEDHDWVPDLGFLKAGAMQAMGAARSFMTDHKDEVASGLSFGQSAAVSAYNSVRPLVGFTSNMARQAMKPLFMAAGKVHGSAPLGSDCDQRPLSPGEVYRLQKSITLDGHPQEVAWCVGNSGDRAPLQRMTKVSARTIFRECIANKNLTKSAEVFYDQQVKAGKGELEASYCFLEGFCDDKSVHSWTTQRDAESLCDMKYTNWRQLGFGDLDEDDWKEKGYMSDTAIFNKTVSSLYGAASCAMGSYHCEVMACKARFCKNDYYKRKHSERRQALGADEPKQDAAVDPALMGH